MTHDEAIEAAAMALWAADHEAHIGAPLPHDASLDMCEGADEYRATACAAVAAYLAAFGVRDLAGLVAITRDMRSTCMTQQWYETADVIDAALSPADETR